MQHEPLTVDHSIEESDELARRNAAAQHFVQLAAQRSRPGAARREGPYRRFKIRHQQRRCDPFTRDIRNADRSRARRNPGTASGCDGWYAERILRPMLAEISFSARSCSSESPQSPPMWRCRNVAGVSSERSNASKAPDGTTILPRTNLDVAMTTSQRQRGTLTELLSLGSARIATEIPATPACRRLSASATATPFLAFGTRRRMLGPATQVPGAFNPPQCPSVNQKTDCRRARPRRRLESSRRI